MKSLLLLFLPVFVQAQSLKPVPVVHGQDTIGFQFTIPQTNRVIEITENGFLAHDSLVILKDVVLEQVRIISTDSLALLNQKKAVFVANQINEVVVSENKSLKKDNLWLRIKSKILGIGSIIQTIIIIVLIVISG